MKVGDILAFAHRMRPNAVTEDSMLLLWLEEAEGRVLTLLHGLPPEAVPHLATDPYAAERRLCAPAPFDRVYRAFLVYMIDLAEGGAAEVSRVPYEEAWRDYARYVVREGTPHG